jgi:DNA-binding PadR family transcriptional regulator
VSVRHALLALLSEGPKYGLRLRQEFEAHTGDLWPLNVGQVYTTLHRLEREGNVASDQTDGTQKRFRITTAGESELARWLRTPPDVDSPPRDELVIKVQVALRMPGVDVRELLQVHRRHMVEAMQNYTHLKADTSPDDVGLGLLIDAEVFRLEAIVRWLDAADARLRHLPNQTWAAADVDLPADSAPARLRARSMGGKK